ncbi:MAG: GIDE domain-containing protein [Candidatus Micrarchaeota archaeon]
MNEEGGGCCCGAGIFFIMGIALLLGGVQRYQLYQKISNTPTSKVRSAAVGLVELFGKARMDNDMDSPISKTKCVYWRVHGEYYHQAGKHSGWRTIFNKASSIPFYLEDETGKMLVDPKDGEVEIPSDYRCEGHISEMNILGMTFNKKMDEKALAFINNDPAAKSAFMGHSGSKLRITEHFIAEGDPLYVFGNAEPKPGASSATAHENLFVKKGAVEQIMYISDSGEKKVKDSMKWSMLAMLVFGFIFSAVGLLAILGSLGVAFAW